MAEQKRQVSLSQAVTLALVLLTSATSAEEYDYYSWQSDNFHNGRFYAKQPQCVDIPADLRLCYNVGYKKMRLPKPTGPRDHAWGQAAGRQLGAPF